MPRTSTPATPKTQLDKFKDAAREHEADDSEAGFEKALRRVAASPVKDKGRDQPDDRAVHDSAKNGSKG
jgi:hypothetical protein